jgi:hypothetical protein
MFGSHVARDAAGIGEFTNDKGTLKKHLHHAQSVWMCECPQELRRMDEGRVRNFSWLNLTSRLDAQGACSHGDCVPRAGASWFFRNSACPFAVNKSTTSAWACISLATLVSFEVSVDLIPFLVRSSFILILSALRKTSANTGSRM